jgi:Subtilase family
MQRIVTRFRRLQCRWFRAGRSLHGYHGIAVVLLCCLALVLSVGPSGLARAQAAAARGAITTVAGALCPGGLDAPPALAEALPGFALVDVNHTGPWPAWQRRQVRLSAQESGLEVLVSALRPGSAVLRYTIEVRDRGGTRPVMLAMADPDCGLLLARALTYRDDRADELLILALDLVTVTAREPLDPPLPAARHNPADPGAVVVAHVDSGVNYLLPQIAERLARNDAGESLGYDFWDLDARPFDGDSSRSIFFPQRHGTRVASLLLAEAPAARLLPFRYPRPDMTRMAEVVARAEAAGAVVMALPLGSRRESDWTAFAAAAVAHPWMLFVVSAGNDGRDIDAHPVYPAALALDNMIVVTSAETDGSLARGSSWGPQSVDLLVPAENRTVIGFDGAETQASGSSFAVPRLAALAARLKARHPDWQAAELKAAIFARAVAPPAPADGAVAVGWLPESALATD